MRDKTVYTMALKVDGPQTGWKKILVLYTAFGDKPKKTKWVVH